MYWRTTFLGGVTGLDKCVCGGGVVAGGGMYSVRGGCWYDHSWPIIHAIRAADKLP
jgi:hypothetical protein